MKFTEEQTIKFVLEYIKHECLLDSSSQDFKNKRLRKAALQQISQKMNIPGFNTKEAYVKMRSLKSTYLQERKKIRHSILTCESNVYTPNVKWFDILDNALKELNFTDDSGDTMSTSVNIPNYVRDEPNYSQHDPPITVTQVKSETEDELWLIDNSNDYSIINDSPSSVQEDTQADTLYQDQETNVISKNTRKRKLNVKMDESSSKMAPAISKMADKLENEFDIFGQSVAAQLKNMPLDLAIEAQMFIQTHLSEIRLKNFRRTSEGLKYDHCPQSSSSHF